MSLIKSLSQMTKPSEDQNIAEFAIYDVVPAGTLGAGLANGLKLQYYPESISIDRATEYAKKHPIGGSHVLYQWIHGSERTLSIDAVFTAETDDWQINTPSPLSSVEQIANAVGNFAKNPISAGINILRGGGQPPNKNHVDVPSACLWLQSKTYPLYGSKSKSVQPPPKLALHMPNSAIKTFIGHQVLQDIFYCVMTRCSIKLTSFFKSGAPRIAEISLSFEEIIQIGNNWSYVSRDSFVYNQGSQAAAAGNGLQVSVPPGGGYNLVATAQKDGTSSGNSFSPSGPAGFISGNAKLPGT